MRAQVSYPYSGDEKQNSSGWSLLWIESDQIFLLPPFECLLLACTAFMFLSLAIVATLSEFFSFLTASPFLENVQWLFVELSQQDLHGAREIGVPALTPPARGV